MKFVKTLLTIVAASSLTLSQAQAGNEANLGEAYTAVALSSPMVRNVQAHELKSKVAISAGDRYRDPRPNPIRYA